MKREDLKEFGLSDEALDKIMALHGVDIKRHKQTAASQKAEADALKAQLEEAGKQIESFKGHKTPEEVEKAVNEWKQKAEQAQRDAAAQLESIKFEHALDGALSAAKAKSAKAVRALLNVDGLKPSDDGIIGLKEQLEKNQSGKRLSVRGRKARTQDR